MAQSQFSLAWQSHKKNICSGLSTLQQNGEFVDMTLAADGHFVKVHQVIVALASPYIKQLISSVECSHPVIFLNKISYATLCGILEYIYTGEVLVSKDNLSELVDAAQELHIKGLEDVKITENVTQCMNEKNTSHIQDPDCVSNIESLDDEICYFEVSNVKDDNELKSKYTILDNGIPEDSLPQNTIVDETYDEAMQTDVEGPISETKPTVNNDGSIDVTSEHANAGSVMQYTVSNQGSLQMILNRYIYYLKHTNRNNTRQWRCVDYLNNRCPATVVTREDVVIQRISAHVHPFHDKKILKKVSAGAIFSAIQDAEDEGNSKRKKNSDAKDSD